MSRFLVPTPGPDGWRALLADPQKQWRAGFSARALAHCWEAAGGFPESVRTAFGAAYAPALQQAEFLLGIPEHRVTLPGSGHPSQNDLWVLARAGSELVSISVEGKVSEAFGPTVDERLVEASQGKRVRLESLRECLGIEAPLPGDLRYQLLHRTASAVIEARRFAAKHAVLLVHSFSPTDAWLEDYQYFTRVVGAEGGVGLVTTLRQLDGVELHAAWVRGEKKYLDA